MQVQLPVTFYTLLSAHWQHTASHYAVEGFQTMQIAFLTDETEGEDVLLEHT